MIRLTIAACLMFSLIVSSCKGPSNGGDATGKEHSADSASLTPELARVIAKEAYIYAYPMVDGYRIQYAYFVAKDHTEFKAPYNMLYHTARVYTPADKAVQTPNSDTPYSFAGLDLRTEPMVLTLPEIEPDRYFSVQLVDYFTHNFNYLGSRTTGNKGGNYLIAGPDWKGEKPKGITDIITCETQLLLAIIRTQLLNSADLANVKKIQAGYKLQPLSAFLGQPAPAAAPAIAFLPPLSVDQEKHALGVFDLLNFQLQFCPTHPSEDTLRKRFARIGIVPGTRFDSTSFTPEIRAAMQQGIQDAWTEYAAFKARVDAQEITSGDLFGTRSFLNNNYMYRMGGAIIGIYGNSKEEAMYPLYTVDAEGKPLHGDHAYTMRFAPGALPPAKGFWSLTMYDLPASLLVSNPLNRYLINSAMVNNLKQDADGGITLYLQSKSPGKALESNWLPAPKGPFVSVMRIYWPNEQALTGAWKQPALNRVQ